MAVTVTYLWPVQDAAPNDSILDILYPVHLTVFRLRSLRPQTIYAGMSQWQRYLVNLTALCPGFGSGLITPAITLHTNQSFEEYLRPSDRPADDLNPLT